MNDRIPAEGKAGRVLITPENGSAPFYATVTMADEPLQEGTPLNKATLLKDATAALLGGDETMVPDEALVALKNLIDGITPAGIGAARVATGSYTGAGSSIKNLTFAFPPKIVFIGNHSNMAYQTILIRNRTLTLTYIADGNGANDGVHVTWGKNDVTLDYGKTEFGYSSYALNASGNNYDYVVIG